VAGSSEQGKEPLGSVKGMGFSNQIGDYQLLKKVSVLWCYKIEVVTL
jgi:hypothetical protein